MIKGKCTVWYPYMHVQPTLSLPRHGTTTRAQPALLIQPWIVHQVPIIAGWKETMSNQSLPKVCTHAGIEPQIPGSRFQGLNYSATLSKDSQYIRVNNNETILHIKYPAPIISFFATNVTCVLCGSGARISLTFLTVPELTKLVIVAIVHARTACYCCVLFWISDKAADSRYCDMHYKRESMSIQNSYFICMWLLWFKIVWLLWYEIVW